MADKPAGVPKRAAYCSYSVLKLTSGARKRREAADKPAVGWRPSLPPPTAAPRPAPRPGLPLPRRFAHCSSLMAAARGRTGALQMRPPAAAPGPRQTERDGSRCTTPCRLRSPCRVQLRSCCGLGLTPTSWRPWNFAWCWRWPRHQRRERGGGTRA